MLYNGTNWSNNERVGTWHHTAYTSHCFSLLKPTPPPFLPKTTNPHFTGFPYYIDSGMWRTGSVQSKRGLSKTWPTTYIMQNACYFPLFPLSRPYTHTKSLLLLKALIIYFTFEKIEIPCSHGEQQWNTTTIDKKDYRSETSFHLCLC